MSVPSSGCFGLGKGNFHHRAHEEREGEEKKAMNHERHEIHGIEEFLNIALTGLRLSFACGPGHIRLSFASATYSSYYQSVVLRQQNVCGPQGL